MMVAHKNVKMSPRKGRLTFIEQLHAATLQLCPTNSPLLTGYKDSEALLIKSRCKQWGCPVCGPANARLWIARILNHCNKKSKKTWFFLTLTAHAKWRGAKASLKNIRQGWKKLYNRMRRKFGISEYVKVWEFHTDSSFHLHVLIHRKISKHWIAKNSAESGMGYICDISPAKNLGKVAGYISKYMLKSFACAEMYPKSLRRIEVSRDWSKLPDAGKSEFDKWIVFLSRDAQDRRMEVDKIRGLAIIDRRPVLLTVDNNDKNNYDCHI